MRRRSSAQTREHMLDVARELFYWHGIRATGVDMIARSAEVAPTTLYRLFASKDDLVAAYVEREAARYREWFDAALGGAERPVRERLRDLFHALEEQVQPDHCRGCPFLMALAEIPDADHPAHREAVALKRWVRQRFGELAGGEALGDQLALIFDGVYGSVQALGNDGPATRSWELAEAVITAAGRGPRRPG
jgi:AcrR family transcriptional regulator